MEYNILTGNSSSELIEAVNKAIKQGWEPIGGVCVIVAQYAAPGEKGYTFHQQAMIRRKSAGSNQKFA